MENFVAYADGSCVGPLNNRSAGWGFLIVQGDDGLGKGRGAVVKEKYGLVITDISNVDWCGAMVESNNTAELTALLMILRWVSSYEMKLNLLIRTDSKYAIEISEGRWKARENIELVELIRSSLFQNRKQHQIQIEHVKGHSGHRWNDRADHLARCAAERKRPLDFNFWS